MEANKGTSVPSLRSLLAYQTMILFEVFHLPLKPGRPSNGALHSFLGYPINKRSRWYIPTAFFTVPISPLFPQFPVSFSLFVPILGTRFIFTLILWPSIIHVTLDGHGRLFAIQHCEAIALPYAFTIEVPRPLDEPYGALLSFMIVWELLGLRKKYIYCMCSEVCTSARCRDNGCK